VSLLDVVTAALARLDGKWGVDAVENDSARRL